MNELSYTKLGFSTILIVTTIFLNLKTGFCQTGVPYKANFSGQNRSWIGPHWWVNPSYDGSIDSEQLVLTAAPNRTAALLPYEIHTNQAVSSFSIGVEMAFSPNYHKFNSVAAGFRLGRKDNQIKNWRRSVVAATEFFDVLYYPNTGVITFGSISKKVPEIEKNELLVSKKISFNLLCKTQSGITRLVYCDLTLGNIEGTVNYSLHNMNSEVSKFGGGIALLTNGPPRSLAEKYVLAFVKFSNFGLSGEMVRYFKRRTLGPILWTQYLPPQNKIIRLQTQMSYLPSPQRVSLAFRSINKKKTPSGFQYRWRTVSTVIMEGDSKTALFNFRMPFKYDNAEKIQYRVFHKFNGKIYFWYGTITAFIPENKNPKVASFSCDKGYLFPNIPLVKAIRKRKPDLLAFLGDQIYEDGGVVGEFGVARLLEPFETTIQDFLFKYTLFAWTFRTLMAKIPTILLLDDHDYYQPNIWGQGGKRISFTNTTSFFTWYDGGFIMSDRWLNTVERVYTGHLPRSSLYNNITLSPVKLKTYFTTFKFGSLDFIILEDRKFKSNPNNESVQLQLLGEEQENYLKEWSTNWSDKSTRMKVAFSQTIFCSAATHRDFSLRRDPFYTDSGAWPLEPRRRVVDYLTKARAFSMHGDQHLGVLLKNYANDEWNGNGQLAFMVPGIANGFPRAWWPGVKMASTSVLRGRDFTGRFKDDAGNAIEVLSVANPDFGRRSILQNRYWSRTAYVKGSGWGLSVFNVAKRTVNVNLFRIGGPIEGEMFRGFPKTMFVGGRREALSEK